MNEGLPRLRPYPFERLAQALAGIVPPGDKNSIDLSLGEPKHATPPFILEALREHLHEVAKYPTTRGTPELRQALVDWLLRRFKLPLGSLSPDDHVLPVNGTREALFAIAQCVVGRGHVRPYVILPNPFYQIYEGAALLAGAQPWYVNSLEQNGFAPDFDSIPNAIWERSCLLYLCTPGNPSGTVLSLERLSALLDLAEHYQVVVASDECYSEIYFDESNPPPGLLEAAAASGRSDYRGCLVFHSLSKRSNVPGMRSGCVAGDARLIAEFLRYRTYHGSAMPFPVQAASIAAWRDEDHVIENRRLYREKLVAVTGILNETLHLHVPPAGFYLWPEVPGDEVEFARGLMASENVQVLPGRYLSRLAHGFEPGLGRVRIALVAPAAECLEAAGRINNHFMKVGH